MILSFGTPRLQSFPTCCGQNQRAGCQFSSGGRDREKAVLTQTPTTKPSVDHACPRLRVLRQPNPSASVRFLSRILLLRGSPASVRLQRRRLTLSRFQPIRKAKPLPTFSVVQSAKWRGLRSSTAAGPLFPRLSTTCQHSAYVPPPNPHRACQLAHWKAHKPSCGTLVLPPPPSPSPPSSSGPPLPPTPTWLYRPLPPSAPISITLPPTTATLLPHLLLTAAADAPAGGALPVVLLFSLLVPFVERAGGTEERLVAQLEEEYGEGLKAALEDEEEWEEDALWEAVGNREGAQEALCESPLSFFVDWSGVWERLQRLTFYWGNSGVAARGGGSDAMTPDGCTATDYTPGAFPRITPSLSVHSFPHRHIRYRSSTCDGPSSHPDAPLVRFGFRHQLAQAVREASDSMGLDLEDEGGRE